MPVKIEITHFLVAVSAGLARNLPALLKSYLRVNATFTAVEVRMYLKSAILVLQLEDNPAVRTPTIDTGLPPARPTAYDGDWPAACNECPLAIADLWRSLATRRQTSNRPAAGDAGTLHFLGCLYFFLLLTVLLPVYIGNQS